MSSHNVEKACRALKAYLQASVDKDHTLVYEECQEISKAETEFDETMKLIGYDVPWMTVKDALGKNPILSAAHAKGILKSSASKIVSNDEWSQEFRTRVMNIANTQDLTEAIYLMTQVKDKHHGCAARWHERQYEMESDGDSSPSNEEQSEEKSPEGVGQELVGLLDECLADKSAVSAYGDALEIFEYQMSRLHSQIEWTTVFSGFFNGWDADKHELYAEEPDKCVAMLESEASKLREGPNNTRAAALDTIARTADLTSAFLTMGPLWMYRHLAQEADTK